MQTGRQIEVMIQEASGGEVEGTYIPSPKSYVAQLKDIYYNRWRYLIRNTLYNQFGKNAYEKMRESETKEINLLKSVVDKTALVYKTKPNRVIDNEAAQNTYGKYANEDTLNIVLKKLNQLTELCGESILYVEFDRERGFKYHPITYDNAEVYVSNNNPFEVVAVRYYTGLRLYDYTADASLNISEPYEYISSVGSDYDEYVYSHTYIKISDGLTVYEKRPYSSGAAEGAVIERDELPVFPFVLFHAEYPEGSLLNFSRSSDLRDATINTAVLVAYHNNLLKYQAHKQGVIVTSAENANRLPNPLTVGANNMLVLPSDTDIATQVTWQDAQAGYDAYIDTITKRVNLVLGQYGVRGVLERAQGGNISGYAILVSMIDLLEKRQDDIDVYRMYERDLYKIQQRMIAAYTNEVLDGNMTVQFKPIEFPQSPEERATEINAMIANKIKTPVDYIIESGQAQTRDEALAIYQRNTREIQQSRAPAQTLVAPVNEGT